MTYIPDDRQYTREHEWLMANGDGLVRLGITDFAQKQLGDIVYVDLPAEGTKIADGDSWGYVESVKSISELYMPVSGQVTTLNPELSSSPEMVNDDPYGEGWLIEIKLSDKSQLKSLLSSADYATYLRDVQ